MKNKIFMKKVTYALLAALSVTTAVQAQESANAELDACVRDEQIALTAKGAGLGALAGLSATLFSGNKDDALLHALVLDSMRQVCARGTGKISTEWFAQIVNQCTG